MPAYAFYMETYKFTSLVHRTLSCEGFALWQKSLHCLPGRQVGGKIHFLISSAPSHCSALLSFWLPHRNRGICTLSISFQRNKAGIMYVPFVFFQFGLFNESCPLCDLWLLKHSASRMLAKWTLKCHLEIRKQQNCHLLKTIFIFGWRGSS